MAEVVISKFEIDGLTAPALDVLRAAVAHAQANPRVRVQKMPIDEFCRLAGLPNMPSDEFSELLREACRALVIVEAVDTDSPDRDDLPYASWPVFSEVGVDGSTVAFAICNHTFDEKLLRLLPTLAPSGRKARRNVNFIGVKAGNSPAPQTLKVFVL